MLNAIKSIILFNTSIWSIILVIDFAITEVLLKIGVLVTTLIYTIIKIVRLLKNKKMMEEDVKN